VPATFDAQGFVDLLSRLRENPPRTLWCPLYDRDLHDRVDAALAVEPAARLIVVEGNYLLLTEPPWDQVRPKLDLAWYLDAPWGTRLERLRQRHVAGGRTLDEAQDKISGTDAPNAELIEATRTRSDRVIWLGAGT
jgi:pantothenate kinase